MQYLSLDINWRSYQPEQQEEFIRDLEDLVKDGYTNLSAQEQQASKKHFVFLNVKVSMKNVETIRHDSDFRTWDIMLQKNEALQLGDWKNMTVDEKKAGLCLVEILGLIVSSLLFRVGTGAETVVVTSQCRRRPCCPTDSAVFGDLLLAVQLHSMFAPNVSLYSIKRL